MMIDGKTYSFTYHYENRLVEARYPDDLVIEFLYDGFGRRVITRVNGEGVRHIYDGYLIVQDRKERTDELVAEYTYFQGNIFKIKRGTTERWVYNYPEGGWPRHLFDNEGTRTDSFDMGWFGDVAYRYGTSDIGIGWAGGWTFAYDTAMPFVFIPESNEIWMPKLAKSLNPLVRSSWNIDLLSATSLPDPNDVTCCVTPVRKQERSSWIGPIDFPKPLGVPNTPGLEASETDASLTLSNCCKTGCDECECDDWISIFNIALKYRNVSQSFEQTFSAMPLFNNSSACCGSTINQNTFASFINMPMTSSGMRSFASCYKDAMLAIFNRAKFLLEESLDRSLLDAFCGDLCDYLISLGLEKLGQGDTKWLPEVKFLIDAVKKLFKKCKKYTPQYWCEYCCKSIFGYYHMKPSQFFSKLTWFGLQGALCALALENCGISKEENPADWAAYLNICMCMNGIIFDDLRKKPPSIVQNDEYINRLINYAWEQCSERLETGGYPPLNPRWGGYVPGG